MTAIDIENKIEELLKVRDLRERQLIDLINMMEKVKDHILEEQTLQLVPAFIEQTKLLLDQIDNRYLKVFSHVGDICDGLKDLGYDNVLQNSINKELH